MRYLLIFSAVTHKPLSLHSLTHMILFLALYLYPICSVGVEVPIVIQEYELMKSLPSPTGDFQGFSVGSYWRYLSTASWSSPMDMISTFSMCVTHLGIFIDGINSHCLQILRADSAAQQCKSSVSPQLMTDGR